MKIDHELLDRLTISSFAGHTSLILDGSTVVATQPFKDGPVSLAKFLCTAQQYIKANSADPAVARSRLYESVTRVRVGDFTIRVWRQIDFTQVPSSDNDIHDLLEGRRQFFNVNAVLDELLKLPRVNAVEIVDREGIGKVGYNDWP